MQSTKEVFFIFFINILGILYGYRNSNATFINNSIYNSSTVTKNGGLNNLFYTLI